MSHSKENGKSWRLDDMYIGFVQSETRYLDIPYHRGRVGFNHLAFHATSRHKVDEITRKLRDRGITILYADKYPFAGGKEHYAVYSEDPDRMKVEWAAP